MLNIMEMKVLLHHLIELYCREIEFMIVNTFNCSSSWPYSCLEKTFL